ncbi:GNAT family N-acetyltransferase [Kribbella italica]|uniref:GNAT superfamily N-acetyltransferase n=1 Tax=Kribbella italica TaxID=1540520 RepID=A0A7W9JB45_9ACTN|nr:GNAT family N-acetyltransferase [Kribbella italica]MBB5838909.1 GNAT superfamily N-acetyltransferase [Kribbella italica]
MVEVRRAVPGDGAGIAAVLAASLPRLVKTARGLESELRSSPSRVVLLGVDEGRTVGYGNVYLPDPGETAERIRVAVQVTPEHRGRGVGQALLTEIERVAADAGAVSLLTVIEDDDRSLHFARQRGFVVDRQMSHSEAVLAGTPDPVDPPEGLRLASYEEVGPRPVWEAMSAVIGGDPSGLSFLGPFDEWVESGWRNPDLRPDLSIVLLDGEQVVSLVSTAADPERGVIWSNLTGTIPAYRGRGLAKVVKSHALRRAHLAGLATASTGNDAANAPMLAVNDWLGYRLAGSAWTAEKTL